MGFDIANLVSQAQGHDASASGNSQLFGVAAKFLQSKMDSGNLDAHKVDEEALMQQHEKVTDETKAAHADEIGGAAALNALKAFVSSDNKSSGQSGQQGQQAQSGGGDMQSKLIAMAMAQAGRLFDEKQGAGLVQGGDKQSAMNTASEQIMKLMVKHKATGMVGGEQSGGLGQLAKIFM